MKKRFVATLLALCMLLSIVPTSAFAAQLDNGAAQPKQEVQANDLTDSAKSDDTQGAPDAQKPDGAAPVTDGQDGAPGTPDTHTHTHTDADGVTNVTGGAKDTPDTTDKPDADTVPDGNGGADKTDKPDADKQDNPGDGADKKDQDKDDQTNVNAVQEAPQQVDTRATAYSPQKVYVYTKVTGATEEQLKDLHLNGDGWYTIGRIELNVPSPSSSWQWVKTDYSNPNYIGKSGASSDEIKNALESIDRYKYNRSIDVTKITWKQLAISNGASSYTDEAPSGKYCWHLDGEIAFADLGRIEFQYLLEGTNTTVAPSKTEPATPGTHNFTKDDAEAVEGYTCTRVSPETVQVKIGEKAVVIFYYTPDTYTYTVKYVEKGNPTNVLHQYSDKLDYSDHLDVTPPVQYDGYRIDGKTTDRITRTNPNITFEYVKDNSQTQPTKYTVKYTIEDEPQDKDTIVVDGEAWINDNPAMIAIAAGGIPTPADKYKGYKLDPKNPEYPSVGTEVKSGTVYTVNYVKDNDQTQDTKYAVKYTIEGTLQDTVVVDGKAWVNDDPAKIAIKAVIAPADKYEGYKLDTNNPEYPAVGSEVNTGSVFTVNYTARTDLTYTVKYLEKGTGKELATEKVVENQTFDTKVTVKAEAINGYTADAETKDVKITTGENVITFYYTKRADLSYTVKYLEKDTNKKLHDPKIVDKQTFGAKVTEKAIDIVGYNKVEPSKQEFTINADKNEITFYYTIRTDLKYTVNYLENGTGKPVAPAKVVENQTFGTEVAEAAISVKGYRRLIPVYETMTIGVGENVINFYYYKPNGPATPDQPGGGDKLNTGVLKSAQTGDTINLSLWFALLFVSGGVLMGTTVIGRKRKHTR